MKKKTQKPKPNRTKIGDKIKIRPSTFSRKTKVGTVTNAIAKQFISGGLTTYKIKGWLTTKDKQDIRRIVREEIKNLYPNVGRL